MANVSYADSKKYTMRNYDSHRHGFRMKCSGKKICPEIAPYHNAPWSIARYLSPVTSKKQETLSC